MYVLPAFSFGLYYTSRFSLSTSNKGRTCEKGEYAAENGCEMCHRGRYAPSAVNLPDNSTTGCYPTPPGFYATRDGVVKLRSNITGATAIVTCEAGKFSRGNTTMCRICQAGFYSKTRASECIPCSVGTYSPSRFRT